MAGSRLVNGAGPLAGLSALTLSDGFETTYDVGLPPSVDPVSPAVSFGAYDTTGTAGVGVPLQTAYLAFPFEGLTDQSQRLEVMRRTLDFLLGLDAGPLDGGASVDAGAADGGPPVDAGGVDAGVDSGSDAGSAADAGSRDAGIATDAGSSPDGGQVRASTSGCGCQSSPGSVAFAAVLLLLLRGAERARRRCALTVVAGRRASE